MLTDRGNYTCVNHHKNREDKHELRDGFAGDNGVEGVGFQREFGSKSKPVKPKDGHLNCGCLMEDTLFEFFMWKTLKIRSSNPNLSQLSEGMNADVIPTRMRSFMREMFRKWAHLDIDNLYVEGVHFDDAEYRAAIWERQLKVLVGRLRAYGYKVTFDETGQPVVSSGLAKGD
jgi:hypothetical protein